MSLFTRTVLELPLLCKFHPLLAVNALSVRGIGLHVSPTLKELKKRQELVGPLPPTRRSAFAEWNYNAEIFAFGKRLSEEFKIELLLQAFVQKEYLSQEKRKQEEVGIENPELNIEDNGALAEIGEEIISDCVRCYLGQSLPNFPLEGIKAIHDYLLSEETLADISKNLGTAEIILSPEYPVEPPAFAQTFKAIVGALHESQGIKKANLFVRDFVITQLASVDVNDLFEVDQPLNVVNDILKREGRQPAEPRLINQSATSSILAVYHVGLYSNKVLIGQGPGETIDTAVEIAARDTLRNMFNTADCSPPIRFDKFDIASTIKNLPLSQWVSNQGVEAIRSQPK